VVAIRYLQLGFYDSYEAAMIIWHCIEGKGYKLPEHYQNTARALKNVRIILADNVSNDFLSVIGHRWSSSLMQEFAFRHYAHVQPVISNYSNLKQNAHQIANSIVRE
jgi:isocitrate/isopropylmalate dehydrogenase